MGSVVDININKKDFDRLAVKMQEMIKFRNPIITREVAHKTLALINASGKVPIKTGALREQSIIMADKFDSTGHIIGWVGLPYARRTYFGAKTKSRFVTVDGQKRRGKYYKGGTQPFWDRPITRNSTIMINIYRAAARKVYSK